MPFSNSSPSIQATHRRSVCTPIKKNRITKRCPKFVPFIEMISNDQSSSFNCIKTFTKSANEPAIYFSQDYHKSFKLFQDQSTKESKLFALEFKVLIQEGGSKMSNKLCLDVFDSTLYKINTHQFLLYCFWPYWKFFNQTKPSQNSEKKYRVLNHPSEILNKFHCLQCKMTTIFTNDEIEQLCTSNSTMHLSCTKCFHLLRPSITLASDGSAVTYVDLNYLSYQSESVDLLIIIGNIDSLEIERLKIFFKSISYLIIVKNDESDNSLNPDQIHKFRQKNQIDHQLLQSNVVTTDPISTLNRLLN